jgi:hypothetical protein
MVYRRRRSFRPRYRVRSRRRRIRRLRGYYSSRGGIRL